MRAENRERLGPNDVVLASHPGSGTSWISTLLVHLGIFYAAGSEELLADATSQRIAGRFPGAEHRLHSLDGSDRAPAGPVIGVAEQQKHLTALHEREAINPSYREPLRVIQTGQAAVGWTHPSRVVLLVRDGRDAVLSLYHNLASFSGLDVSLADYLNGNDGAWPVPAMSWGFACLSWVGAIPPERLHVLRFETCRARPLAEFQTLLAFLGVERSDAEVEHAIAESSYQRMREKEAEAIATHGDAIGRAHIMRKGKVGGWREVYTEEMLATFAGLPRRALERFGYP